MSRLQLEIVLGFLLIMVTSIVLVMYGINEETRMQQFAAAQEAQAIEVGAYLYENNCSGCHGTRGEGIPGLCPPLNNRAFFTSRLTEVGWSGTLEDYIIATVSSGRLTSTRPDQYVGGGHPAMPAWSDRYGGPLRDDQIRDLARYILNWRATAMEEVELVDISASVESDDPLVRGESLFRQNGCGGCHALGSIGAGVVGPNLNQIGTVAAERVSGMTAEEYVLQSIIKPNTFIVPECPGGPCAENVMPQNFADLLSDEQLNDLVIFLLSHK